MQVKVPRVLNSLSVHRNHYQNNKKEYSQYGALYLSLLIFIFEVQRLIRQSATKVTPGHHIWLCPTPLSRPVPHLYPNRIKTLRYLIISLGSISVQNETNCISQLVWEHCHGSGPNLATTWEGWGIQSSGISRRGPKT